MLKGLGCSIGVGPSVPQTIIDNKAIVWVAVADDWYNVETSEGVYDWSGLDKRLANAKAAGFKKVILAVTNSQFKCPKFILDKCEADGETFVIPDAGEDHPTFCDDFRIPLWWAKYFHARRLALVAAMGKHYAADPAIMAVFMSFMNVHSMDWDNPDVVGFTCNQNVNMVQQWLDHGWTREKVLLVGKEICDATAVAFPNQVLKLPIGGMDATLAKTGGPDPLGGDANYTTLAREITAYIYSRPYKDRIVMSRNVVAAHSPSKEDLQSVPPRVTSQRYIFKMIADNAPSSGLQTVDAASRCHYDGSTCRQGNGPCGPGLEYETVQEVMQASLDVMLSYHCDDVEVWTQDAQNPLLYDMMLKATKDMGGVPRP